MDVLTGVGEAAGVVVRCPRCKHVFCFDCDAYIHESLHNCPGCEALAGIWGAEGEGYDPLAASGGTAIDVGA